MTSPGALAATMQRSRRPHGPEKGGEDEDLMSWIETPSSPLPDDRFTRRPSLEPENGSCNGLRARLLCALPDRCGGCNAGELVIRMRPSTGSTAQTSEQQDGAHASSKGVSLVLSAKRRLAGPRVAVGPACSRALLRVPEASDRRVTSGPRSNRSTAVPIRPRVSAMLSCDRRHGLLIPPTHDRFVPRESPM